MALPKRKLSSARTRRRRAQWKIAIPTLVKCPNAACGKMKRPHAACGYCGYYNGVAVVEVKEKKE